METAVLAVFYLDKSLHSWLVIVNFINISHERVRSRPTKWLSTRASGEGSTKPCVPPGRDRIDNDDDDAPVKHFPITWSTFLIWLISITSVMFYRFQKKFGFKDKSEIYEKCISKNNYHSFFIKNSFISNQKILTKNQSQKDINQCHQQSI